MTQNSADRKLTAPPALAIELLLLAGFCAFFFFFGLNRFGLVGADEPRYAQIAREMLSRHDWITPILNGTPWLEKPPLYYWGAMLSYSIFGVSDWAARLPTAVFASALVIAVYFFALRFRRGIQLDASLIVASSALIIGFGRAASTDMPLTATLTMALLAWLTWHETTQRRWLALSFCFLGLGMLAKGPVAPFFALVFVGILAAFRRDWKILTNTLWWPGILLFLAVSLPWYVLVQLRNPGFFRFFILEQNLARYTSNEFRHPQPFWYFLPIAFAGLLPWTLLVIAGIVRSVRDVAEYGTRVGSALESFLLIWGLFPIFFFSLSQSKLPGYILPSVSPLALLGANYLWRSFDEERRIHPALMITQLTLASALLGAALVSNYPVMKVRPDPMAWMIAIVAGVFVFAVLLAFVATRGVRFLRLATLVPVVLGVGFVIRYVAPTVDLRLSARPVAATIARLNPGFHEIAVFEVPRDVEYGLNFYRNHPIARYERNEVPEMEHLVIARPGSAERMRSQIGDREIADLGSYRMQNLEIYWVSAK